MYQEAAAIVLIGVVFILVYFANHFPDQSSIFTWIKIFFFGLSMFFLTLIMSFGKLILENSGGTADMITLFSTAYRATVIISYLCIALIFISFLAYTLKGFSDVDKNDVEMYGRKL